MFQKLILICILFMVVVFSVITSQAQSVAQDQKKVVLRINSEGGLCPYGGCYSEVLLYNDGTGLFSKGPTEEKPFVIDSKELNELLTFIKGTNFEAIRKSKFIGECSTAYDGTKFIYTFSTSQGEIILDSCENVIDEQSPLFKVIQRILEKAYNSGGN